VDWRAHRIASSVVVAIARAIAARGPLRRAARSSIPRPPIHA